MIFEPSSSSLAVREEILAVVSLTICESLPFAIATAPTPNETSTSPLFIRLRFSLIKLSFFTSSSFGCITGAGRFCVGAVLLLNFCASLKATLLTLKLMLNSFSAVNHTLNTRQDFFLLFFI